MVNNKSENPTVPKETVSGTNKKGWKTIGEAGKAALAFTVTPALGVVFALFRMIATGSKSAE